MLLLSVRAWERDSEWELECNIVIVWQEEEEEAKEVATPTRSPSPLHSYVFYECVHVCVCDWWCQLLWIRFVSWRYRTNLLQIVSFRNRHTHTQHSSQHAQSHTDSYLLLNKWGSKVCRLVSFHFYLVSNTSASPGGASAPRSLLWPIPKVFPQKPQKKTNHQLSSFNSCCCCAFRLP